LENVALSLNLPSLSVSTDGICSLPPYVVGELNESGLSDIVEWTSIVYVNEKC
jgi:hypothetical protein